MQIGSAPAASNPRRGNPMSNDVRKLGRLTLALCLAGLAMGCVTSGQQDRAAEEKLRLKKARSHLNLGVDYLRTDRVALAIRELLLAEEFDPKNARIQFAIGEAYLQRDKPAEAEQHYLRVLELAPDYHDARLNLSAMYLGLGRYEECIAESRLLADDATFPGPWRALANQGWAEYKLGRKTEARHSLGVATDYSPSYWPALLSLGILDVEDGRRLEAVGQFQKVLDHAPHAEARAEVNYRLGEIYVALGNRERAVDYLMSAVVDSPGGPWGNKSEEYLKLLR
jgi:type IV pilus assembly protein PilF